MSVERIVVGIDLSPGGLAAVDWSAREARRRDAALIMVHGVGPGASPCGLGGQLLATFRARARTVEPRVDLRFVLSRQSPVPALVEASAYAGLVVLGSRGRAGFTASALGSIAQQVIVHAACPVVVVPPERAQTRLAPQHRIVAALAAATDVGLLDCAAELAWSRGAVLHLVPVAAVEPAGGVVARAVAYLGRRYPGVRLDLTPVAGEDPFGSATRDADLLVVGCRHADGLFGCRPGAAASRALVEAQSPVVLVGSSGPD